jgi:hypothetical protein
VALWTPQSGAADFQNPAPELPWALVVATLRARIAELEAQVRAKK